MEDEATTEEEETMVKEEKMEVEMAGEEVVG